MSSDSVIRASDADRERVLAILREAYAAGRLTLAEFDERTTAALSGRTWGDLRSLTGDLPPAAGAGAQPPGLVPSSAAGQAGERPRPGGAEADHRRLTPVVPVALAWFAVLLAAHIPGAVIPVVFLLLVGLGSTARFRGAEGCGCACSREHSPARGGPPDRSSG